MAEPPDSPRLVVVGANFRTSTAALREKLFVAPEEQPALLHSLRAAGLDEAMVLATCDRVEIAAVAADAGRAGAACLAAFAGRAGVEPAALDRSIYRLEGRDAVRHLFAVASSLDSMITGEPQVLGQVKESQRIAQAAGSCGRRLDSVLDAAYRAAKRVRSETAIGERPVSIAAAAERLARSVHGDLRRCAGVLLGDGDMGELIAAHLLQAGLGRMTVAARIEARAEMLARRLGCNFAALDNPAGLLAGAEIAVSATASGRLAVTAAMAEAALAARRRKPIFFIDAAVPGDVERTVNDLDGAFVYDLADLEAVAIEGRAGREAAAAQAARMVDEAVAAWLRERAVRRAAPAVVRLRRRFEALRAEALRDAGGDADAATRLLANRLLHGPTSVLRALAEADAPEREAAERLLARMFDLEDPAVDTGGGGEEHES